jgi:hypothetical protein
MADRDDRRYGRNEPGTRGDPGIRPEAERRQGRDYGGWYGRGTGRTDQSGGEDGFGVLGRTMGLGHGGHRGRGPRGYRRSDERIREDVNDRLADDPRLDASEIEVRVENGEVTLDGTVDSREARRRAEDLADSVSGVSYVQNNLRAREARQQVRGQPAWYEGATTTSGVAGLDAGMGSAGVSARSGNTAGSSGMGAACGSGAAPGVTGTTGAGYSTFTGTNRTGGSTRDDEGRG